MNNQLNNDKKMNKMSKRYRNYCLTSFKTENYVLWDKLDTKGSEDIQYLIYQMEETKDGKRHIQGYVEFKTMKSLKRVKEIFSDSTLHIEPRRGTAQEASDYCSKAESRVMEPVKKGEISRQGTRTDIKKLYDLLKEGKTPMQVCEAMPSVYMKYYKAVDRVYTDLQSQQEGQYKEIEVNVLYGDAGAGKTRYVYDKYGHENVYRLTQGNGDNIWFDGYTQQKVVIFDDYYGWLKYSKFLQITDNYKIRLSVKGGTTYSNWDKIYITSNQHPSKWYNKLGLTPAMERRFKSITKMTISEKKVRKPEYNIIHTNEEGKRTTIKFKGDEKEGSSIVLPTTSEHLQDEKKEESKEEMEWNDIEELETAYVGMDTEQSEGELSENSKDIRNYCEFRMNGFNYTFEDFKQLCEQAKDEVRMNTEHNLTTQ
jgi:hypothetical protein